MIHYCGQECRLGELQIRKEDKCMQCYRQQTTSYNWKGTRENEAVNMHSSRTIINRTVLLWALVLIATLSCGVQAAPEPYQRRQIDVIPPSDINDLEDMGINVNIDDPKLREEILLALLQMYKNEMQKQGAEDEQNGLDSGALAALEALPNLPLPAAIQAKLSRTPEGVNKEEINKRGSYQPSLCYFKICNMGRKRNIH